MRITEKRLRRIIKEEVGRLSEVQSAYDLGYEEGLVCGKSKSLCPASLKQMASDDSNYGKGFVAGVTNALSGNPTEQDVAGYLSDLFRIPTGTLLGAEEGSPWPGASLFPDLPRDADGSIAWPWED